MTVKAAIAAFVVLGGAVSGQLLPSSPPPAVDASAALAVAEWRALRANERLPFERYAAFLLRHKGWPNETALRTAAERNLLPGTGSASQVVAFFTAFPPQTAPAALRHAEALDALGRSGEARTAARTAWTKGALSADDETRLLSRFGSAITQADHDARMDALLWAKSPVAAARQFGSTSPSRQPLFDLRIALLAGHADAGERVALPPPGATSDAGFLVDHAFWLRTQKRDREATRLLASRPRLDTPPRDPLRWLDSLLVSVREAQAAGDWDSAYRIGGRLGDAYPAGTSVKDKPLAERDDYTSLAWAAGVAALDKLNRPRDAIAAFERYAGAARSPQTQSKGLYWAARAAERAGDRVAANAFLERAAVFVDQFHGQLANERLGRPLVAPAAPELSPTAAQRSAYAARDLSRAATYLGQSGDWFSQSLFLRAIAAAAISDEDHLLAYEFSRTLGRPDLAVMVGRSAGVNGYRDQLRPGFPTVTVPPEWRAQWTVIHAIARQESQFDRKIVSRAGARGLMQLMPGTARETAGKLGIGYSPPLLDDAQYNIQLGAYYIARLRERYGGNLMLAAAAYNAGAGNVNKWIAQNGDPRLPGADVLRWIEAIPFTETRGYVQRVLENAVVYDMLDPTRAAQRPRAPLSAYLGKSTPG